MKKLTILFIVFFTAFNLSAQNVAINNDGTTAATSAMLDVKSTTKGMLMPRMTSAQRGAIASPVIGLLVFDTDTKTIWTYDGTAWKNLYTSGGGLTLPFSQSTNQATSAFQVANQGTGAAIEGSSTAQFGIGMTAKSTGEGGWGLLAFTNGAGSQSIRSYADNGTAFHGENNNPANTNTLMDFLNKGAGSTVRSQLANASSTAANMMIAGNHLGNQLKVYQTNAANTGAAVSIENSGTGIALEATSTTGYAIKGVTNTALGTAGVYGQNTGAAGSGVVGTSNLANTQGVYGLSQNGIAVRALGDNYRAVQAASNTGTAIHATSTSGYAIESNGNVKIAGGNTNPGAGKVLTSDASGNATWQESNVTPTIGFRAVGLMNGFPEIAVSTDAKVQFETQQYDLGNNFISVSENGNLSESSVFFVPVNGLYHFDCAVDFAKKDVGLNTIDYWFMIVSIKIIRNGQEIEIARFVNQNPDVEGQVIGSTDIVLNTGDKVFITARQHNLLEYTMPLSQMVDNVVTFFSGHIVKKL